MRKCHSLFPFVYRSHPLVTREMLVKFLVSMASVVGSEVLPAGPENAVGQRVLHVIAKVTVRGWWWGRGDGLALSHIVCLSLHYLCLANRLGPELAADGGAAEHARRG